MYLQYLIQEQVIRNEISNISDSVLENFQSTFSTDMIYSYIMENLGNFIQSNDMIESYNSIKNYARQYTIAYLNVKAKELS